LLRATNADGGGVEYSEKLSPPLSFPHPVPYLDHNATAPLDPAARVAWLEIGIPVTELVTLPLSSDVVRA